MYHGIVFRYLYPFINMPSLLICFNLYIHDQYNGFKIGERPRIATQSYNNYIPINALILERMIHALVARLSLNKILTKFICILVTLVLGMLLVYFI